MSADNYDDLDDLLDDSELQNKILANSPFEKKEEQKSADVPDVSKLSVTDKSQEETAQPVKSAPKGTEQLPKELESLLQASSDDPEAEAALKTLLKGLGVDAEADSQEESSSNQEPKTFEDTISATMDRLNQTKKSNGTGELDETALMEKLLQDMQKSIAQESGLGGGGAGGIDGLLSTLLSELSSKDVLYDPLKELHTGYPAWLTANRDKLDKSELARYEKQQKVVEAVILKFEDPSYSDSDKEARDYITEKMVEMQDTGAPPKELVGDVAGGAFPGFPGMGGNSAPDLPGDCATQ